MKKYRIPALEKAIHILRYLSRYQPASLSEIYTELELPKATAHQILSNLCWWNFVRKSSRGYVLGLAMFELGGQAAAQLQIAPEARDILEDLSNALNLTANLGIRSDDHGLYLITARSKRDIFNSCEGKTMSLRTTALGKALLFEFPEASLRELLPRIHNPINTPYTIKDDELLIKDILKSKERGWAFEDQEDVVGFRCVAAPFYNQNQDLLGAISITGAIAQLHKKDLDKIVEHIKVACRRISEVTSHLTPEHFETSLIPQAKSEAL